MKLSSRELFDLGAAWVALGLAFTFFILSSSRRGLSPDALPALVTSSIFARVLVLSMATVGVGFLLHELAHKVVAVRFGQVAAFRADYSMLALAVFAGLVGFLFAAPGAVYHRGRITPRQNGLISVAGPLTNVAIAGAFFPLLGMGGFLGEAGQLGVTINLVLAAFNMIPFGPLDGRKVLAWSKLVFLVVFLVTAVLGAWGLLIVGFPY